jgi:hypothetical protein
MIYIKNKAIVRYSIIMDLLYPENVKNDEVKNASQKIN